jgi:heptosyltransferase-3
VKILVLHPGALGDIVLSLPALAALRRQFPSSRITLAGNTDFLPYSAWGHADRVVSLAALPLHKFHGGGELEEREAEWWRSFDLLISWTGSGSAGFENGLVALGKPSLVAGWRPKGREPRHVSRIFMDSLQPWVPFQEEIHPARIPVPEEARLEAREWLERRRRDPERPLLAMHPGASGEAKRWPAERLRSVAARLEPSGDVLIIEGPAESGLATRLADRLPPESCVIAASVPLRLLAAILSSCDAYLGNDSGISHLAAGLGLRSIVIFGPTPPEQWSPLGTSVVVLHDTSGCVACDLGQRDGHSCLDNITVERVCDCLAGLLPV